MEKRLEKNKDRLVVYHSTKNNAESTASESSRGESFISEETIPYVMPEENSLDIDEEKDWKYGEFLFDQLN